MIFNSFKDKVSYKIFTNTYIHTYSCVCARTCVFVCVCGQDLSLNNRQGSI